MDEQSQKMLTCLNTYRSSRYSILYHFEVSRNLHGHIIIQDMTNYDWEIVGELKEGITIFRVGVFPNNIFNGLEPINKGDLTAFRYTYLDTHYLVILDNNKHIKP